MNSKSGSRRTGGRSAGPRAKKCSVPPEAAALLPSLKHEGLLTSRFLSKAPISFGDFKTTDAQEIKKISLEDLNVLTLEVGEFLRAKGLCGFRYNETLNGLRHALLQQFEFLGIEVPSERELQHTEWWKLRDYMAALEAASQVEK